MSLMVPVIPGQKLRSGVALVTGFMPTGLLLPRNYYIPYHNPNTLKGYQRPPQEARINELVADLRKGLTDMPTAVLLNLRNREAKHILQDNVLDLSLLQDPEQAIAAATQAGAKFYVVDGQHRILALLKLLDEHPDEDWENFLIPFVCMLGATEEEEMAQFYIVNSKAKSVRTDLAHELLQQLTDRNPELMEGLIERGRDWQVAAQQLVRDLADGSPVWRGRIRFAAMEKEDTVMPSASMVTSLKPVLTSAFFRQLEHGDQLRVLDAFWRGLRKIAPDAFDFPESYVLQKGLGVIVLHTVLVQVVEIIRARGESVTEPDAYAHLLTEPFDKLQGDDRSARLVSGIDFWRAGPDGAAGSYSSSAGRRVLISKIQALLPRIALA
jgi:DGQHR domain-containing protein